MNLDTSLERLLSDHAEQLQKVWLERTLAIYPKEYGRFVSDNLDPFSNPVGAILRQGLEALFEALLEGAGVERCRQALDPIIRVKAVQDISPSQALAFVPLLKELVRETLRKQLRDGTMQEAVSAFDARVDQVALLAFDLYAECRERIFNLRVNELKRNAARLRERPGGSGKPPADTSDPQCRATCEPEEGCCP